MVEIKSYPAKNGDAFLLKATNSSFAMLVDGGYADTFLRHIKADLRSLATSGRELSVVVATHVDADHISGLLSFFRLNGRAEAPAIIPVREVLHNSLRSLAAGAHGPAPLRQEDLALLQEIRRRGYPPPTSPIDSGQEISARQGSSLADLLFSRGYRWNTKDGTLATSEDGLNELRFPNARLRILGPNWDRLDALKRWWVSEIRRLGVTGSLQDLDDVFEFLCAYETVDPGVHALAASDGDLADDYLPDNSITNGSSISFLLEIEALRLLFLADASAEDVVTALKKDGPAVLDAIKVAHHGSARNTSPELLTLVDSPHFFISTNGEGHEHPDFSVLKAIVDRPANFRRTLHFNYSTPASRRLKTYRSKVGAEFAVKEEETNWVKLGGQNTS